MYYPSEAVFFKQPGDSLLINDICFFKYIILFRFNVSKVLKIACIGKLVSIHDKITGIIVHEAPHHMGADKSGTSCYKNCIPAVHDCFYFFLIFFSHSQAVFIASSSELTVFQPSSLLAKEGSAHIFSMSPALLPVIL